MPGGARTAPQQAPSSRACAVTGSVLGVPLPSVERVAVAGLEEAERAAPDEVEGVGDDRVQAVLGGRELDDRALRRRRGRPPASPSCRRCPASRRTPSLVTVSKIVPTTWNELSIVRPGVEDEDPDALAGPDLERGVLVLVGDAVEDDEVGRRGRGRSPSSRSAGSPCGPRYHSLWTSANSLSTWGRPSFGSTMTMPYMPLAMWWSAGAVPQWYIQTPA